MTTHNFRLLPHTEQVEKIYADGVFIGKKAVGSDCFILYQLDSFYVEIRYKKYRYYIHSVDVFQSIEKIDPYLAQVSVGELIKMY